MINKLKNTPIRETKKPYVLSRAFNSDFSNRVYCSPPYNSLTSTLSGEPSSRRGKSLINATY